MTDHDIDIIARTICGEARGEGQSGMEDVACVIMTRTNIAKQYLAKHDKPHSLFGDGSPASACLRPYQFSCWNKGEPNRAIIEALGPEKAIFRQAMNIAQDAAAGKLHDRTRGATHYKVIGSPANWAVGRTPCFTEGRHEFYNDIP
ncbi:MAG: cell wall hydrolase [Planctomycetes bacterium]|nr:cell wall hydrolase [Planctomycetota bacterium]